MVTSGKSNGNQWSSNSELFKLVLNTIGFWHWIPLGFHWLPLDLPLATTGFPLACTTGTPMGHPWKHHWGEGDLVEK
jgi:hypothetical protein